MRAVIYARVSSQAQKDKHTIASQLSTLPQWVVSQGWELVKHPRTYVDDGKTAKAGHLDKRDGFNQLMRDMANGQFDVVAVVDQDRLTRSEDLKERGEVLGAFQRAHVKIAISSTGQVLDLGSSMGDLLSGLQAFFSAEENRKRRERTKRGKLEAIRQGKKPAGPTPFGYSYERGAGTWSPHPINAPIVREMFQRVSDGESCERIAFDMETRGVKRARGGHWNRERVWQIVTAKTYMGQWIADKAKGLHVPVPRLVSDELWEATQTSLTRYGKRGLKRIKHVSLCQGVAICGLCGSRIGISSTNNWHGQLVRYYMCTRRRRPRWGGERCSLPMLQIGPVDERVWASFGDLLSHPERIQRALEKKGTDADDSGQDWAGDLAGYERQLKQLESTEAVILEKFSRGLLSQTALDQHLERSTGRRKLLGRQIETAKAQVVRASSSKAQVQAVLSTADQLRGKLPGANPQTKREIVLALVSGTDGNWIEIGPDEISVNVALPVDQPVAHCGATDSSTVAACNYKKAVFLRLVA